MIDRSGKIRYILPKSEVIKHIEEVEFYELTEDEVEKINELLNEGKISEVKKILGIENGEAH